MWRKKLFCSDCSVALARIISLAFSRKDPMKMRCQYVIRSESQYVSEHFFSQKKQNKKNKKNSVFMKLYFKVAGLQRTPLSVQNLTFGLSKKFKKNYP